MDRGFSFFSFSVVALLVLVAAATGCGSSDDSGLGAPDVTGAYNIIMEGGNGCADKKGESTAEYWTDWANGPLRIDGSDATSLSYDFGDPMIFDGLVDVSWSFQFAGDKDWLTPDGAPANISVYAAGLFTVAEDGGKELSGEFDILVDDDEIKSNNCKVNAEFSGYQL
jgi:hypothetical protein